MRIKRRALLVSWVLLCGVSALPAAAQQARTLAIQAGEVYIDGQHVPQSRLPASWQPTGLEFQCSFTGNPRPVLELDGQLYRLEEDRLTEVDAPGAVFVTVCAQPEISAPSMAPVVGMQPFAMGRALAIPAGSDVVNVDAVPGQEILEQQARELEELSREVLAYRMPPPGVVSREAFTADGDFGRLVREQGATLRQLEDAHSAAEAAPLADKLRLQAERAFRAARELPRIEFRNYLNDMQGHNRELYQRLVREQQLEQESLVLANQIRQLERGPARQERETVLRGMLEEIFTLKQENRRREIEELKQQLTELQRRLDERERLHEQIIQNRLKQLTGESTGANW